MRICARVNCGVGVPEDGSGPPPDVPAAAGGGGGGGGGIPVRGPPVGRIVSTPLRHYLVRVLQIFNYSHSCRDRFAWNRIRLFF